MPFWVVQIQFIPVDPPVFDVALFFPSHAGEEAAQAEMEARRSSAGSDDDEGSLEPRWLVVAAEMPEAVVRLAKQRVSGESRLVSRWRGVAAPDWAPAILKDMPGSSMTPSLQSGDVLYIDLARRVPARREVVAFHPPPVAGGNRFLYIKRAIGLPGETVELRDDRVLIDGQALDEPYASPTPRSGQYDRVPLGADEYFQLGDNRSNSADSRQWGSLSAERMVGTVRAATRHGAPVSLGSQTEMNQ